MSIIINTRSPFYKKITNNTLSYAKLELYIWSGEYADRVAANKRYTLTKNEIEGNNFVTYELSKLIRDFMETEYNNYATDSQWVDAVVTMYDENKAIIQVGGQDTVTSAYLAIDGYGYFEDGINPRSVEYTTPMLLQNNTTIYYVSGEDIQIPIYAEAETVTATLSPSTGIPDVYWDTASLFWEEYTQLWNSASDGTIQITDNGNTNQKIQYLLITGTEDLASNATITLSSSNTTSYPTSIVIKLESVCEPKYTPLSIIFYNKYGALQNMWFFKKSMTDINIKSETFKNTWLTLIMMEVLQLIL